MILTILQQIIIMFLLAGVGYLLYRADKISDEGSRSIGNILLYVSLPSVIINGFLVEKTPERLAGLGWSVLAAAVILALSALLSGVIFRKDGVAAFSAAFSNPGFYGIPLIVAQFDSGAVFYIAAFIAFLNLLQWSWGVSVLEADKSRNAAEDVKNVRKQPGTDCCNNGTEKGNENVAVMQTVAWAKKLVKAPFFVAIVIGILLFFLPCELPAAISKSLTFLANLNTPLAMFVTGIYLAQTDMRKMFLRKRLYLISALRLVAIPLIAMAFLCLLPASMAELKLAVLVAAACPVGTNVAVYAQLYDCDYPYAVETVVISTLLSVVTLPLIVGLGDVLWKI